MPTVTSHAGHLGRDGLFAANPACPASVPPGMVRCRAPVTGRDPGDISRTSRVEIPSETGAPRPQGIAPHPPSGAVAPVGNQEQFAPTPSPAVPQSQWHLQSKAEQPAKIIIATPSILDA
jgi:hypothetical protein